MQTVTSADGTTIAYDRSGSGPLLIMITGATCFRRFFPVVADAKALAQAFTVINYDRCGRGDSADHAEWAIDKEVDDIEALIDANGGPAILYGHSSGAVLALEAALRLPSKVRAIAAYDASYVNGEQETVQYAELSNQVDELLREGQNAKALKRFLTGIGMPKAFVTLLPVLPGWSSMKRLAPTLRYDIALTKDQPDLARIARIAVPTLLMVGGKSPGTLRGTNAALAGAIPAATATVVEGQDHMVSGTVVRTLLADFVSSADLATG